MHHGLFRFVRMPFRLINAPRIFQCAIDIVLCAVRWKLATVYLDDIVLFSETIDNHKIHLKFVLTLFKYGGLTVKLRKCVFLQYRVEYLKHIITPECLHVASKKCHAVQEMKLPTKGTQLHSFWGICNVFRRFFSNFAPIAAPLTNKRSGDNRQTFPDMPEDGMTSFRRLKDALIKPPVPALPRSDLNYVRNTDACEKQLGTVLMKRYENKVLKPIGYY